MADEQQAIAQGAPETASTATQQPVEEPINLDAPETASEEAVEEFADWELDGKAYKVPKPLTKHLMLERDYTQKRQADAETARQRTAELEARAQQLDQQSKLSGEDLRERAQLFGVDERLAEYQKLTAQDWAYHRSQDPAAADDAWTEYQLLKEQRDVLKRNIDSRAQQRSQESQQSFAKRLEQTKAFAQKEGISSELSTKVLETAAKEFGLTREFVTDNMSPEFLKLLHRAHIGAEAMKKPAAATPNIVQPLTTVGAKSNPAAGKSLADMDMDDYVVARKKGYGGGKR